ncbi:PPIC-type PPIASE domain-containing protein [Abditibacterium utsteinense]|uniref:PPIC-type PPIASE domain-containing protein n=1 Tax=Abditibacterium utsteinense TaxID=1960156 RepID=A0A2S8SUB1_9BACT|nr:peptidyl-prolyl cis-trans isomerase [Abditibacterium utsteinense]PQV64383.1 PPIC-type PPIASE domain-containing protein [Abditibacterium utsteinense]
MKHSFKPGFALAGLTCALFGATLAGCNNGGATGAGGASSDTLATVGSAKVTRADLTTFLEAQGGEQALPILIDTQLVMEALKAKSLDVTDAEVDAEVARLQANNPAIAEVMKAGGAKLDVLKTQVKSQLAAQKLLTAGITATDAQVKSFFEKNRSFYDVPEKTTVGMLLASSKTRADLMAQQLQKKTKTLVELVAEQKKAADPVAANSTEGEQLSRFPAPISARVAPLLAKLQKGGVTPVQKFAEQAYAVFVLADKTPAVKADLAKIRPQVEADYKSAEVAKKTVKINPQNPPFDETLRRTFESVKMQNPNATLHDALNYINQTTANELIAGLRSGGSVQIDDANYAKVATQYQAKAAATDATGNSASGNSATGNTATGASATGNAATPNAAPTAP